MAVLRLDLCHWVVSEEESKLIVGEHPCNDDEHFQKLKEFGIDVWVDLTNKPSYEESIEGVFLKCPLQKKRLGQDSPLFSLVEKVYDLFRQGKTIYVHCSDGHGRCDVFACCFLRRYDKISTEEAIEANGTLCDQRLSSEQKLQISRYRPPQTVIVIGDHESANSFRPIIFRVLRDLPPYSIVVHGTCRGVDIIAGEVAKKLGVQEFPVTSGPEQTGRMLKTNPDYVLAFHPDILYSKGTKDMMMAAHLEGVPVYVYDLKDKREFRGDIKQM